MTNYSKQASEVLTQKLLSTLLITLTCTSLLFAKASVAGKAYCQSYLQKLQQVQVMQKQGYSAKKGELLKRKEDQARKLWWQCENNKLPPSAKNKAQKKKSHKNKK